MYIKIYVVIKHNIKILFWFSYNQELSMSRAQRHIWLNYRPCAFVCCIYLENQICIVNIDGPRRIVVPLIIKKEKKLFSHADCVLISVTLVGFYLVLATDLSVIYFQSPLDKSKENTDYDLLNNDLRTAYIANKPQFPVRKRNMCTIDVTSFLV